MHYFKFTIMLFYINFKIKSVNLQVCDFFEEFCSSRYQGGKEPPKIFLSETYTDTSMCNSTYLGGRLWKILSP